ncbi:MAG: glycerol-3-phosphate 1-O-acyltransferase PlsY [Epsilonproteobacteria bacterium]|nr:glycerol-3-phosphate 1-O-acyltransferase PlsY [Campylobacterota bacterium]
MGIINFIVDFLGSVNGKFYLAAYLVGSIPFGLILAKMFAGVDVTKDGSGSIGATNVLRVLKQKDPSLAKKLGAATLFLDAFKGIFVLIIASLVGVSEETKWAIAVLAVIGHCFSPFLKFEGGKGVATGVGVMLYMLPLETVIAIGVWALSAKTIRISSVSSLLAVTVLVIASFIIHPDIPVIKTHAPILIIYFIIIYKHLPNIAALLQGKEKRVV